MDDGNFVESISGRERVRLVGGEESASKHGREGERRREEPERQGERQGERERGGGLVRDREETEGAINVIINPGRLYRE